MIRLHRVVALFPLIIAWDMAGAESPSSALPQMGSGLLQMLAGLALVVGLIFASLWLLKKISAPRGATAGLLRVVAGTAVGPRERVVLVEIGDDWLVLGVAPGQVNTLHRLPRRDPPAPPTETPALSKEFGARLRSIMESRNGQH
jgi:flagellar protein FliO/FliZ